MSAIKTVCLGTRETAEEVRCIELGDGKILQLPYGKNVIWTKTNNEDYIFVYPDFYIPKAITENTAFRCLSLKSTTIDRPTWDSILSSITVDDKELGLNHDDTYDKKTEQNKIDADKLFERWLNSASSVDINVVDGNIHYTFNRGRFDITDLVNGSRDKNNFKTYLSAESSNDGDDSDNDNDGDDNDGDNDDGDNDDDIYNDIDKWRRRF